MTPFLPVMTGRVVTSLEVSERFLWDLRRTISELVIANYAGAMSQLAHEHGLEFTAEAYGSPCDHLPYAGQADEPMGEFWVGGGAIETCRGMASAAHTYGKPIVGAEAFTATDSERWHAASRDASRRSAIGRFARESTGSSFTATHSSRGPTSARA